MSSTLKTATTASGKDQLVAIDDLGERHESATTVVPELQKLLASNDDQVQWHAARSLGDYEEQAQSAVAALRELLNDADPVVQYHAVVALGRIGDRSDATIDPLVAAITNPDGRVARAAVAALRNLKPDPDRVMEALEKALDSDDTAVTTYALNAVVERGAQAVPILNAALKRPKTAYLACAAIEAIGPPAADTVPALVELIDKTAHSQVETQALLALAAIGPAAKSASPAIIPLLNHETDATVPVAAAFALGSIGAADADAQLKQSVANNGNPFLQMVAAWALAKNQPQDEALVKQAVDKLTQGLSSSDPRVRSAAARGLELLKAPPEVVGPALLAVAQTDPNAAANVVIALASLGEKVVPKAIEALAKPEFQQLAVNVLTKLGPQASAAVEPLIQASKSASPQFRTEINFALASIGPAAAPATASLSEGVAGSDDGERESALYALRHIGPGAKDALPALQTTASGGDAFEALAAAWAIASIAPGDNEAAAKVLPLLIRGLSDHDEVNRLQTALALGDFGPAAMPALNALTKAAHDDSSDEVREAAADAVTRISASP